MPAPPAVPPQLGRYRLLAPLGSGGMGAVFLAEDTLLSRRVALKLPHKMPSENPLIAQRFLREARTAASIEHPNLCPIHDVGEADGFQFLVMPFIEGTPLSALVDDENPWEPERALALVKKLAIALQVLHERGLIHRDLKPANVMIRYNGEPVIMDFGLAKSVEKESQQLTQFGSLVGTPSYMPPEQVQGDLKALGPATDVYSLGIILYELLTGEVPFLGTMSVVFGQILHAIPDAPSVRRPSLPAWLDTLCLKALAKKPEDRYPTMAAFVNALDPPIPAAPSRLEAEFLPVETMPRPARETQPPAARVVCPKCSKSLKVPAAVENRKLVCPRCQEILRDLPREKLDTVLPLDARDDTIREPPQKTQPRRLWVSLSFVVLLTSLIVWRVIVSTNKETNPTRPPSLLAYDLVNSLDMKFVRIPAGKFFMGSPEAEKDRSKDETQHEVEITKPFFMGIHEVTQEQYERVMGVNPSAFSSKGAEKEKVIGKNTHRYPVEKVSWDDAKEFCRKLSAMEEEKKAGRFYRLPTEAEWEYACRGGRPTSLPFGIGSGTSLHSSQANFYGKSPYGGAAEGEFLGRPCDVGSYKPNGFGLYDMHGNVWEWCEEYYACYDINDKRDPQVTNMAAENRRVLRGGSWYYGGIICRSAYRDRGDPGIRLNDYGFRVICVVRDP